MSYEKPHIRIGTVSKFLLIINVVMALIYFSWWFVPSHVSNPILYSLLLFGECYHVLMAIGFWMTIWPRKQMKSLRKEDFFEPSVDIFIPTAGEPVDLLHHTIQAAKHIQYPHKHIYILNDGYVTRKDNWRSVELLAEKLGVSCITRTTPGGSKAGNINHALHYTNGEIIVIFDADMIAHPAFLEKTLPYFQDPRTGFVQTPQYYKNFKKNLVTQGSWIQQELFFGPIMYGKASVNSAFICGTNVAIRRTALLDVGGMYEENIAEDFLTSLFIHQRGWKSYYLPEVLVQGLAPEDILSYVKQQLRWARGSLEVLFTHNPLYKGKLTWNQRLQYLLSSLYYFNGLIVFIDCIMPLIFLFFGIQPVAATTTSFALFFIPFMFLNLYTLYMASNASISFQAISFVQSSWVLQLQALFAVLFHQKMGFSVTPKKAQQGNFLFLAYPHIAYIFLMCIAIVIRVFVEGINPSVMTNIAWAMFNSVMFVPFIMAAA